MSDEEQNVYSQRADVGIVLLLHWIDQFLVRDVKEEDKSAIDLFFNGWIGKGDCNPKDSLVLMSFDQVMEG